MTRQASGEPPGRTRPGCVVRCCALSYTTTASDSLSCADYSQPETLKHMEELEHLFCFCPNYAAPRAQLHRALQRQLLPFAGMQDLLSKRALRQTNGMSSPMRCITWRRAASYSGCSRTPLVADVPGLTSPYLFFFLAAFSVFNSLPYPFFPSASPSPPLVVGRCTPCRARSIPTAPPFLSPDTNKQAGFRYEG